MGYTATRLLVSYQATDAQFRAWGSQVSAELTAMGLPKTADTGQIDWATVTVGSAISTSRGYEIRTFNDALQATAPVVFKLYYATGSANYHSPALQIQVGRGSDGAGNLTAPATAVQQIRANTAGDATSRTCIFAGDTNRMAMALFAYTNSALFLSLERTKDETGADTADGVLMFTSCNTSVEFRSNWYIPLSGSLLPKQTDSGIFTPMGVTTGASLTDVAIYPNFFFRNGQVQYPGLTHLGYFTTDVPDATQGNLELYGQNHNYYFISSSATGPMNVVARGGITGTSLCLLYE